MGFGYDPQSEDLIIVSRDGKVGVAGAGEVCIRTRDLGAVVGRSVECALVQGGVVVMICSDQQIFMMESVTNPVPKLFCKAYSGGCSKGIIC